MKQQTLTGFEKYGKTTRRAQFLADMERIIPWPEMSAAVETVYPKSARTADGRRFRWSGCCGSTSCSSGSTCRTRRLRKRSTTRWRCAASSVSIWGEGAPDETTVCKFRHLLERNKLGKTLLTRGQ